MASLWENLIGRSRPVFSRRPGAKAGPRPPEPGPWRRYLAVVARDRPDLLPRVSRLFLSDGNVEAILDRRHGERRRRAGGAAEDRRRVERRQPPRPGAGLVDGAVIIAQASATAVPERLIRWMVAGQEAVGALDRVLDDLAALERECAALRASVDRLQAENRMLRAREAMAARRATSLAEDIARPLGEIIHRLRTG